MDFSKIKESIKKMPRRFMIYLTVAAVCTLALIFMREPKRESSVQNQQTQQTETVSASEDYAERLSLELKEILSDIQGVSNVSVMVTVDGSEKKIFASDLSESDLKSETKTVIIGSKEALEEGIGYPKVKGVLVVCRGGGSPSVKEKVVNAVSTVLDIPTGKVFVTNAK